MNGSELLPRFRENVSSEKIIEEIEKHFALFQKTVFGARLEEEKRLKMLRDTYNSEETETMSSFNTITTCYWFNNVANTKP